MKKRPEGVLSLLAILIAGINLAGCQIVEDGTVGISKTWGTISNEPLKSGVYLNVPFVREVEVWNVKATKLPWPVSVPSIDGMMVRVESTVIFRPVDVVRLRKELGWAALQPRVLAVVSDTIREKIGKLNIENIIQNQEKLNAEVREELRAKLTPLGFAIDDHMLTELQLPQQFLDAVGRKLEQKQKVEQKEFELKQAATEADIEITRAKGSAQAQEIVRKTLNPEYLQYLWISNINNHPNVIYVPTEANMPLFRGVSPTTAFAGKASEARTSAETEK